MKIIILYIYVRKLESEFTHLYWEVLHNTRQYDTSGLYQKTTTSHIKQIQYLPSYGQPSTHITICLYGLFLQHLCNVPYNGCPSGCRSISIPTPCKKCTEYVIMSHSPDITSRSEKYTHTWPQNG
jgi:hypothetical protein